MKKTLCLLSLLLLAAFSANAAVVVLTFEGLQDNEAVDQFYNGGLGGNGSGPGTNFGVDFAGDGLALIDADAGGSGNFANEPTPDTILYFLQSSPIMNVSAGFSTGFSFFYTAINNPGIVTVYDDINGGGNVLAVINLPVTSTNCSGDPFGSFCKFDPVGVAFAGVAKSVDFGGTGNQIGFDNITFGSSTPVGDVPEPGTWALMAGGLAGLAFLRRRK